ncbi:hypothetical protein [Paraburkholderia sp. J63]|uniref:hypothetical protein n=1 Tax=Paraburkholderia sp. J63 TaxID=2805434 RepID=UPI002ABD74C7|nr:hypothetical protein [Paraburkholderia sp. J63]
MRVKLQPGIANDAYYGVGASAGAAAALNAGGAASAPNIGLAGAIAGPNASAGMPPGLYPNPPNPLAMPGMMPPDGMQPGTGDPQNGPLTNRVTANPDGSHDVYSFDATGNLRAGQNYDANGNLASSFAYDPNERGGTLTSTRFSPDGSAQVDKAGGGLHTSYIAGSDGQMQNLRQEPLSPADLQKLEQWKASSGQLQAVASNLPPDASMPAGNAPGGGDTAGPGLAAQPASAGDMGGGDMAGIGTQQQPAQSLAPAAQPAPANDTGGGDMAGIGTQQQPAQPPGPAAPPTMDNGTSGSDMAGPDGLQRLASQLSNMAPGLANELLPKIASELKNLIEQLFSSAMPNPPAQPGASPADAGPPSLTTAGS